MVMKYVRMRMFGLLVVLLTAAAVAAAGEEMSEKLDNIRRIINERGEYDLAERQLRPLIDEYRTRPAAAEALVLLGYCLDKQDKNSEAASAYMRVLQDYPGAPAALRADASLGAADANFRLRRYQQAIECYSTVLSESVKPEQTEVALLWRAEARNRLALEERDAGRDARDMLLEAAGDYASFFERWPESKMMPTALSGAAFACFDLEDYERAIGYYRRFIQELPGDRRAEECRYYIGESLYRMNRFEEARAAFADLLSVSPDGRFAPDARSGIAWADYGMRRIAEAAEGFEEAAQLAGTDEDLRLSYLYDAGCAWREAGDPQKAGADLLEVARKDTHDLNGLAWYRLGTLWQEQAKAARDRAQSTTDSAERKRMLEAQKKYGEDAVRYFRRAIASSRLGAEEVGAYTLLGEVLLDAQRWDEASIAFADLARRWPDSEQAPWALYHRALAQKALADGTQGGEKERYLREAAASLQDAMKHDNAKIRLQAAAAHADYLMSLDDVEEARKSLRWLANDAEAWAAAWRGKDGKADPQLAARAHEYAADSTFRLGESYYFASDLPRAGGFYQILTEKFQDAPQSAMAQLRLGEIAESGRDAAAAQSRYEQALRAGAAFGKARVGATIGFAHLRLGILQLRQGQRMENQDERRRCLQEAMRQLQAVLDDPPADLEADQAFYYLAESKYSLGLKQESMADYQGALDAAPSGPLADASWFGLAWARKDMGDTDGAMAACHEVLDRFPASAFRPDVYTLMASIKRAAGDAAGALTDLNRFLDEFPDSQLAPKAELERASALDETGQHEQAAKMFAQFLADHPEHPDVPQALYQQSWALWNAIRPMAEDKDKKDSPEVREAEDKILASLRSLTERYPDYPVTDDAWLRIGEILYDRGEYDQALGAYQRAQTLAETKNSGIGDKARYRAAWSIQRIAEAQERASTTDPDQSKREAARKDMWDKRVAAIDAFESILGRYPQSPLLGDACFRAAELRRRSGQDSADPQKRAAWLQSAIQRYTQALEKSAPDAPYRRAAEYYHGLCLLQNDDPAAAREVFRTMLLSGNGPYSQDCCWGLGQANLTLGAYADATSAFEQALSMDKTTETAAKSRYGLGLAAAMAGDREKARMDLLTVDSVYPQYPEWAAAALVRAARFAIEDNMYDRAIGDLERVLARYPESAAAEEARELQASITAKG